MANFTTFYIQTGYTTDTSSLSCLKLDIFEIYFILYYRKVKRFRISNYILILYSFNYWFVEKRDIINKNLMY